MQEPVQEQVQQTVQEQLVLQQDHLRWVAETLGPTYFVTMMAAAGIALLLTLVVVCCGYGSRAGTALWFLVPLPFWVGIGFMLDRMYATFSAAAIASAEPASADLFTGLSVALVGPIAGLVLMVPSYLLATLGTFARSLFADEVRAKPPVLVQETSRTGLHAVPRAV